MNLAYRKVIASFGGVYVLPGPYPNPYLQVPDRDIVTRDGGVHADQCRPPDPHGIRGPEGNDGRAGAQ